MTAYQSRELQFAVVTDRARGTRLADTFFTVSNDRRLATRNRWKTGFSLHRDSAGHLRGLVELYQGHMV